MKVKEGTLAVPAARRHIIRRPRLTRMLDESGARIILLVAPAGYGKTTLAREWLEEGSRPWAWYQCSSASADVAAFSVGISTAAASVVSRAGERMRKRLKATAHPDEDATELAEMFAEDLAHWPNDTWLVIDDYHFAVGSSPAEQFIQRVLERSSVQLLATSRRRPAWASARRRTYGEILEVDRTMLSMTDDEGRAVLAASKNPLPLLTKAQGWPAVIGMAALTGEEVIPDEQLPATLYDYIAEELYDAADAETRWGLCQLAIAGVVTQDLGRALLKDRLETVLEHGTRLGIAIRGRQDADIELHPLLRRFLREKIREFDRADVNQAIWNVTGFMLRKKMWDEVFELAQEFGVTEVFEDLLRAGVPSVLATGRVSTVQRWVDFAAEHYFRSPLLDFAEAELAVRQGLHAKAETLALQAASTGDATWAATAFTRAGRAAHLDGRPTDAIRNHRSALGSSPSTSVEREALWGLVVALVETEEIEAAEAALKTLDAKTGSSVDDMLRVASGQYLISVRAGRSADAGPLTAVLPLIERSQDPMARSSFLNSCTIALTLNGRYSEAQAVALQLLNEAEDFRLHFVLPYAHLRLASVAAGVRRFAEAFTALEKAETLAAELADRWMSGAVPAVRAMILLSAGETDDALASAIPVHNTSASVRAEMLAVRALALACAGEYPAARALADRARSESLTLEAWSLGSIADAIGACLWADPVTSREACAAAFEFACDHGTVDHFVAGYRAFPPMLRRMSGRPDARLPKILVTAGDEYLASEMGIDLPRASNALSRMLSPREREVFDLMAGGLTNKEIGRKLFISESTTKVHVRHIFEKLDARTRTEAVIKGKERLADRTTQP